MRELPDLTLRYADHADGLVDVHLPAATTRNSARHNAQLDAPQPATRRTTARNSAGPGVALLVHGGFWKAEWDRTHTRAMARALADLGWVVATPEYRRVGPAPGNRGGWPQTCTDIATVAERLPELLGDVGVEVDGIRTVGHSAGGHLVLWLAATHPDGITRTVALAPVCDLREAIRLDLGGGAARRFLGGADPGPADPMLLPDPPGEVRIVHGVDDTEVPIGLSRGFVARHPGVRLDEVPLGHYELIEPGSPTWPAVVAALAD